MDIVAEGVERIEQVAHLKRFGIRQAQGYLFAPALPAKQYLALVKKLGVADHRRNAKATANRGPQSSNHPRSCPQIEEAKADVEADAA
jgi:predicted signal transduction protein with EAL and GGDEF domain